MSNRTAGPPSRRHPGREQTPGAASRGTGREGMEATTDCRQANPARPASRPARRGPRISKTTCESGTESAGRPKPAVLGGTPEAGRDGNAEKQRSGTGARGGQNQDVTGRGHGTRNRYVWGPDEHDVPGHGCHCTRCTRANRAADNHRTRMLLYGTWQPYVNAGPAREHVQMLSRAGIGWRRVAALAGVSTGMISQLLYGGPGGRPPSRRIRPRTAAAILAVQPGVTVLALRALIAAHGTHRRLQALVAIGWSQNQLAIRLGMALRNFCRLMRSGQVTVVTARAVTVLYDELWDQPAPEAEHREKIAASRARNYARARAWAPPAAWDDDEIDDPAARPAEGWERSARRSTAAVVEEAQELETLGHTREQAAARLGVTRAALDQARARAARRAAA